MSEDLSTLETEAAALPPVAPPMAPTDADVTRIYAVELFGRHFAVKASGHPAVRAHMVRKLRDEIDIRLGTFVDGHNHARMGIEVEVAGEGETAPLFGDGGTA